MGFQQKQMTSVVGQKGKTMAKATIPVLIDWNSIKDYMAQNDVIQVVRCKDCMWHYGTLCRNNNTMPWEDDDFCSKAERDGE